MRFFVKRKNTNLDYNCGEYFGDAWEAGVKDYFYYGYNHCIAPLREHAIYVYSFFPNKDYYSNGYIEMPFSTISVERDCQDLQRGLDNRKMIAIVDKNGKFLGYLDKEVGNLYLTDLTHKTPAKLITLVKILAKRHLIKKLLPKEEKLPVLTLGGDPEFELIGSDGYIVYAEDYIDGRYSDSIGVDGSGNQVELRPEPAKTPEEYVEHIRDLFRKFIDKYPDFDLSAEMIENTCGGHIHVGEVEATDSTASLLDALVGKYSKKLDTDLRKDSGYGMLGDIREQPHGLEYRVLPATIYYDPELVRIIYKIVQNALTEALKNGGSIDIDVADGYATKDSLLRFITEDELDYFSKALYRRYKGSVIEKWVDDFKPISKRTVINFADTWNEEIKDKVKNYLTERLPEGSRIFLFGLAERRGITFCGYGLEPHVTDLTPHSHNYGLPYLYRTDVSYLSDLYETLDKIIAKEAI